MTAAAKALLMAACVALCVGAGWLVNGWRLERDALRTENKAATAKVTELEEQLQQTQAIQQRADALTTALATSEQARQTLSEEKSSAIRKLTVGRRCLDDRVVRVLNDATVADANGVSAAASEPVSAAGTFATDTDVGEWINLCRSRFETCNDRLGALGEFFANPVANPDGNSNANAAEVAAGE